MRDKTAGVATEEFGKLKPKMYWSLVDVFLNKKCLRHSMSKIRSKDHKIATYEIIIISLSCFDEEISIQNNGYDELALGY